MPISNFFDPQPAARAAQMMQETVWGDQNQIAAQEAQKEAIKQAAFTRAQEAALNIERIQNARAEREKSRGMLDLEKRKQEIAIEEAKMKGNVSNAAIKAMEAQMKTGHGEAKKVLDAQDTLADHAHDKFGNDIKQSVSFLQALSQEPQSQYGMQQSELTPTNISGRPLAMAPRVPPASVGSPVEPQTMAQPSIPMGGRVDMTEQAPARYEIDLPKTAETGAPVNQETAEWKAWQKNKEKEGAFSINALKIDENDKALLEQVYSMRQSGTPVDKAEILANLSPETATSVQGLINYDDDPKMYSTRNNARVEAVRMARMVDPTYDPTKYEERKKYRMELASEGSFVGKQRIALNTVAQHIAQLDSYIDALGGGNLKPQNMVVNFAKDMTGNPNIATYEQANEAVMSEMQRLLTGVGVTQAGMSEARKIIDRNTGYDAKKAALKSLVRLVEGRISPLKQSFEKKMGRPESGELVYPETQEIFDRYLTAAPVSNVVYSQTSAGTKYRKISE